MLKLTVSVEYRSKETQHAMEEDILEAALSDREMFVKNPSLLVQFLFKHDMDIKVVPISFEDSDEGDELEPPFGD